MHITKFIPAVLAAGLVTAASATLAISADNTLKVIGVQKTHHLNVRKEPSLTAPVLTGVLNDSDLKSAGCKDGDGGKWCNVTTSDGVTGWSFSKYLSGTEAAAAPAAAAPAAAPAAPAPFALGTLKCERNNGTPVADCSYGVMRAGVGKARLQLVWPDATKRMFGIYNTTVTTPDGPAVAKVGADGSYDITLTPKGAASEHFMVPAGVILTK